MTPPRGKVSPKQLNDKIGFGKYKEKTVQEVMVLNPSYLIWAHANVAFFKLDNFSLQKARAMTESRHIERKAQNRYVGDLDLDWDSYEDRYSDPYWSMSQ